MGYIGVLGSYSGGWDAYMYVWGSKSTKLLLPPSWVASQFNLRQALPACYVLFPPFSEVHTGNDQRYIMPSNMRVPLGISRRKGLQERNQNKKAK